MSADCGCVAMVRAPPLCLGTWHIKMGGGGPCLQRTEDLVGRNRQGNVGPGGCCRSREVERAVEEMKRHLSRGRDVA